nr:UDP-N-acetylenolpyruvoylglucosamine reductase [uncultured bacterium]
MSLHALKGVEKVETGGDEVLVHCLAGTPKSEVAKVFSQNRLAPAIFLTGIPGDMGAGVVMNAGIGENRVPREFCEIVKSIEVLRLDESTGQFSTVTILGRDINWEYRHSSKWQPGIITRVVVGWKNEPDAAVSKEVVIQTRKRVSTQPLDQPNCGSVFRNPLGHKSAQLIEQCGLKGFRVGGASVSKKHSNFIVNDQGASANDVHKVIEHVRKTVLEKTGVELKTEGRLHRKMVAARRLERYPGRDASGFFQYEKEKCSAFAGRVGR